VKNFLLYGHGGSLNHGEEAIAKTTINSIRKKYPDSRIILSSHFPEQDKAYKVPFDKIIGPDDELWAKEKKAVARQKKYDLAEKMYAEAVSYIDSETVCLSIGGDNYCYSNWHRMECFHNAALRKGAKSILWSCSIEPEFIDKDMLAVLAGHHAISARENITYKALCNKGLKNVFFAPDIAFSLKSETVGLPNTFENMIALNLSPLALRHEAVADILLNSYKNLVAYILKNMDMGIALVPHVEMPMDNDSLALDMLFEEFKGTSRIYRAPTGLSAAQYKYIISKCRLGVFTRTHASIAAYSSCVPCIAIGYSVKAKGIAEDVGLSDYVLSVENIKDTEMLVTLFKELTKNEKKLRLHFEQTMPIYLKNENICINQL
jgi:polysaccharide pyruvyl transferase WcaK-like protein